MTVVNPKSISGINSITTGSGSDDILTIHTNNGTERLRVDSTGTTKIVTGIVTTLTATSSAKVGSGVTLSSDGDIFATGVTTATTFSGSGASLTNLPSAQLTGALPALDGSNLTGLSGVSVASQADNRLITCTGTSDALTGESNLSFTSNTLTVHEASLKGNQLLFGASGTAYIDHSTTGQDIQFRTSVSSSQDTTGPTIKSTGNIAFASGKGIDFSATSDGSSGSYFNELLDDYEEGVFTPTWNAGGGVTFSYSQQHGWYTKIGDTVTFHIYLQGYASTITGGNSGNQAKVTGLPFSCRDVNRYYPPVTIGRTYKMEILADKRVYAYQSQGSTDIYIIQEQNDHTGTNLTAGQLDANTTEILLMGVYKV